MRHGLLQVSFISPIEQRDLRDLTRYRTKLVQEHSREVNRVQGVLERANIKLASVATDIMGVSARAILAALVEGLADPATMAEWAKRRIRSMIPLLEQALTGLVGDHHRQLLAMQLAHIDFLDVQIEALSAEIMGRLAALSGDEPPGVPPGPTGEAGSAASEAASVPLTFAGAVTLLDTIPGVNQRGGELLVAEWGIDMGRVGTAARLAAWSGVAPGNEESAGKQRSGKTRQGGQTLRTGLTQLAHMAARTRGPTCRPCINAWPHAGGRNGPSSRWPTRSWSVPSICSSATNPIGSWGPITLMTVGSPSRRSADMED